jgi:hypothetical protein
VIEYQKPEDVLPKEVCQPDGSLYDPMNYLAWRVGEENAVLDGRFSAEDLRAIADHMDKHRKR